MRGSERAKPGGRFPSVCFSCRDDEGSRGRDGTMGAGRQDGTACDVGVGVGVFCFSLFFLWGPFIFFSAVAARVGGLVHGEGRRSD
jgi:hypothetical protein